MAIWQLTTGSISDTDFNDGDILSGDRLNAHEHFGPRIQLFGPTNATFAGFGSTFLGSFVISNPPGSIIYDVSFTYDTISNQNENITFRYRGDAAGSSAFTDLVSTTVGQDAGGQYGYERAFTSLPTGSFILEILGSQFFSNTFNVSNNRSKIEQYQQFG